MNPVATEMASVIPPSPSSFSVKTKNMTHSTPKPTSSLSKPPLNLTDFKHLPGNPTQESGESGSVPGILNTLKKLYLLNQAGASAIQEAEAADTDGWGMQAAVFDMGKNLASKIQTLVSTNVTLQSTLDTRDAFRLMLIIHRLDTRGKDPRRDCQVCHRSGKFGYVLIELGEQHYLTLCDR